MINVIICDDNAKDRENAKKIVNTFMKKNKKEYETHIFNDYNQDFYDIIDRKMPSKIYLLDIETPTKSGIDVARTIRKKDVDSVIIFLTVHEELGHVILKNDLLFLSFINKFDDFENRLYKSLGKSLDILNQKSTVRINDGNVIYTINIKDILYITKDSFERKTIIKTDYTEIRVRKSMNEIIGLLDERFTQTHRACFVNEDRIFKVDKAKRIITFDNEESVDLLSDKYKRGVLC